VSALHDEAIIVDGLTIAKWGRPVFEDMRRGGLTAASCTCCVWENFVETMRNIARWKRWFAENSDIIRQVHRTADIRAAKLEDRTGIILSFQNVSAFEDQLGYIGLFRELGVGMAQLAYNTQNLVGSGCYESRDGGLSDFGREVVAEMNRVGMMCDLSHVGPVTSRDAILASTRPVCYSHCLPAALKRHPRNKSDEELRFIAEHGGVIGVAGEDNVGIGTDFTQGQEPQFFHALTHDKGYARPLAAFDEIINPLGLRTIGELPNLTAAMEAAGWPTRKILKVFGENWVRVLHEVWI
jgi:membrane dipeptidase